LITSDIRILHITNNMGYGGVQKIIYQLSEGTKEAFSKVVVASSGGVYVQRLQEIGVDHYTIPDVSTKKISEIIQIIKTLDKIIIENKINVIQCHHRMAVLFAKRYKDKVKIIFNNHTTYSNKALFTHCILKNVKIIAVGAQAKKNVVEYFKIPDKNVVVINNTVDEYKGEFNEVEEIEKKRHLGNFIVLNVGRMHPQKAMNYYLDAAKILVDKGYAITFFIAGDGPLRKALEQQIQTLHIEDNVVLLGFRKDVPNVMSQADVIVMTSICEGLPLTPIEAFSVRKAVIATNIDGTNEVIIDKYNGLLAESKDAKSIAEKIEYLYLNRNLLDTYNSNAYDTYVNKFSPDKFLEQYLDYYSKL